MNPHILNFKKNQKLRVETEAVFYAHTFCVQMISVDLPLKQKYRLNK